jgi:hypothetical protein
MNVHLSYAIAYGLKADVGGGFRGAAKNIITGEVLRGEVRETIEEARNDAKRFVWQFANGRGMSTGTYKSRKGSWKCNYYIRADEAQEAA